MEKKKITAGDTIGDVLSNHPEKTEIMAKNLKATCLGCPMSQIETLRDAAKHHDVDIDKLLKDLNKEKE